jgi:hypothetical protein
MTRFSHLHELLTGDHQRQLDQDFSETRERLKALERGHQKVIPLRRKLVNIQTERLIREVGRR